MPNLTSNATTYRRGRYAYTGFISTIPQTVVLAGTVTAIPSYPALAIAYTLNSGSEANALPDLTVNLYGSGGARKGTLRVATGATSTSTSLKVSEFSAGTYDVQIGDTFQVVREWRIWDRLVAASSALDKDSRIAYTDQNADPYPVANSGGVSAGFGTTRAFDGSTSFPVDPDSSSLTHLWGLQDATPSSSTSASPSGVVFPVGFRWIRHAVTDGTNSKVTNQYVPVWAHDKDTYPPLAVQVDTLAGRTESGWRCTFKLPVGSEGSITNLPDGALVVYWEQERYGETEASYGSNVAERSNVKFVGYLVSESIHIDPDSNEVTFEAVSPLAILEQTPALPQLMVSAVTPAKWSELKGLSSKKMLHYISSWHTSLQDAFDFVFTDALDVSYDRIAVEGQTIAEQLRDIANSLYMQVTCDRLGRILFTRDPVSLTSDERAARTKAYDLTTADVMELDITRNHRWTAKTVRGEGITSVNAPVFSNAPGDAPASLGIGSDTLAKQIVTSQGDLNTRTGYHFAKINSLYYGRIVPKGVRVKLPDGYDIFDPAYREFITLAVSSAFNSRGISFTSATKWTIESVDILYDAELGTKDITLTIDHETATAAVGTTYIPPQEGDNGLSEYPPLEYDFPILGLDPGTGLGVDPAAPVTAPTSPSTKNMAAFCTDNKMYLTADFETPESGGGPTWEDTDISALSGYGGGDLVQFEVKPYSPAYIGTGDEVNGYILTDEAVQSIEDIFGTPVLGTAYVFADASEGATIKATRGEEGFAIVARWVIGDGVYAVYTTDGGTTWDEVLVTSDENTDAGGIAPGVFISPHTNGKAYISVWSVTGDNTDAEATVYRTTDYGATWSALTSPTVDSGVDVSSFLAVPFNNTAATKIYHRKKDTDGLHLMRNFAGVETDITPEVATLPLVPVGEFANEVGVSDTDTNTLAMIGVGGSSGTVVTEDGLGNWSVEWDLTVAAGPFESSLRPGGVLTCCSWVAGVGWKGIPRGENFGIIRSEIIVGFDARAIKTVEFDFSISDGAHTSGFAGLGATVYPSGTGLPSGTLAASGTYFYDWEAHSPFTPLAGVTGFRLEVRGGQNAAAVVLITRVKITGGGGSPFGGSLIYALCVTENAEATEPTWDAIASGDPDTFPYREVFALSPSTFLVLGEIGAIGIADSDGIDSRMGDISTTGRICGTAGA